MASRATLLFLLLGAVAPTLAQLATTTTSASNTVGLFVMNSPTATQTTPTISVSIMRVVPTLTQTEYWVDCPLEDDSKQPPCNWIHGASVTVNPTAMVLNVGRSSQLVDGRHSDGQPFTTKETWITVTGTASCKIDGTTTASCTGKLTSSPTVFTWSGSSTWGSSSTVVVETISSAFADVAAHTIPVKITAGLDNIPKPTTSTTSKSTGGGARPTGQAQAVVAGLAVMAGGMALL